MCIMQTRCHFSLQIETPFMLIQLKYQMRLVVSCYMYGCAWTLRSATIRWYTRRTKAAPYILSGQHFTPHRFPLTADRCFGSVYQIKTHWYSLKWNVVV